jgi:hypothetical protein
MIAAIGIVARHPYIVGAVLGAVVWLITPHPGLTCKACGTRHSRAPYAVGAVSAFAAGSYYGARRARDMHAVLTGRIGNRLVNKAIGRGIVSRLYRR